MTQLKIIDHEGKERLHDLVDEQTTIGRASANTIQVTDEKASRQHFRIDKAGERFRLVDLGSTNGTRLNGMKLQGDVFLRPGDKVGLGKTLFIFDEANAPKGAPEASPKTQTPPPGGMPAAAAPAAPAADPLAIAKEAPAADGPKYILKMLEGANVGKVYELGTKPVTLGRHASNTIQIIDDAASNYHAEVAKEPIGYVVTDLGSTNGTRVKVKQKTEFEKVVKTPLSVGMQIRVGKTVLEFQNIGKQVEDEALFGTVALDPDKLEQKLAEPPRGMPMPVLVLLALAVFAGVVYGVVYFVKPFAPMVKVDPGPKNQKPPDLSNKVQNGDFTQGTDDEGNPKYFKVERGTPEVKVEVVANAEYENSEKEKDKPKLGLRINKLGKSPSVMTAVMTASTIGLDPGKVYELSGSMRNDGAGLFGLRVSWLQGERVFSEDPVVLKATQEWKEKSATLTPPPWAQRVKVGVFVQGNDGYACFDDLSFHEKPGAAPTAIPAIRFGAVGITFEGGKGMFTGTLQGETVIEDGSLRLITRDGLAIADLAAAVEPQPKVEPGSVSFDGRMYDFAISELTNYRIQAQQGAQGVELKVAVDSAQPDVASTPQLRFYLAGAVAQGDVEVTKPGAGATDRIGATDGNRTLEGIEELLFNAGRTPQLDLLFSKPADVELRREGKRRCVVINFKAEVQVALAPESVGQKRGMTAAMAELRKAADEKRWGDVETKLKPFRDTHANRFVQAREEAARVAGMLEAAWQAANGEMREAVAIMMRSGGEQEAGDAALAVVDRVAKAWVGAGADKLAVFDTVRKQVVSFVDDKKAKGVEKDAEKQLALAQQYVERKVFPIARAMLQKLIDDPALAKTDAVKKAKELLAQVETKERRAGEINALQDDLRAKVKNYVLMNEFKNAIDAIEKDKRYQDNRNDLIEINALLDQWRKKVP